MAHKLETLRLAFAGTSHFAARQLAALLEAGCRPAAVLTQPDRPAGRGKKLQPSPVKQLALEARAPLLQPRTLRGEDPEAAAARGALQALELDVLAVAAYGLILPQAVLDMPKHGCINAHASLLPRWRGAAPVQRAIEAGDGRTGITIMQMDAGLDTGPMLVKAECAISPGETAGELTERLAEMGGELLLAALGDLPGLLAKAAPQDSSAATYARKVDKAEAQVDWNCAAADIERKILAFNPAPGCWTMLEGQRLKVWRAHAAAAPLGAGEDGGEPGRILAASGGGGVLVACGDGIIQLTELQLPGGRAMSAAAMLNSRAELFAPGNQLGPPNA